MQDIIDFLLSLLVWSAERPILSIVILFIAYVIIYSAYYQRKWRWLYYVMAIPFVILDAINNIAAMTVLTLDLPREWLVTGRLKRYKKQYGSIPEDQLSPLQKWRYKLAIKICRQLNKYDPNHC